LFQFMARAWLPSTGEATAPSRKRQRGVPDIGPAELADFPRDYIGQALLPWRWERHEGDV